MAEQSITDVNIKQPFLFYKHMAINGLFIIPNFNIPKSIILRHNVTLFCIVSEGSG